MKKLMFLYDSLHTHQKELIDKEIESYIKSMIIKNREYGWIKDHFKEIVYELVLRGKQINKFLGEKLDYFNLKEIVVKARVVKIFCELEQNRPSRDLIESYIELCKELDVEPMVEVLFDKDLASKMVKMLRTSALQRNTCLEKNSDLIVDNSHKRMYTKNSNIIYFENLFQDIYEDEFSVVKNGGQYFDCHSCTGKKHI